MLTQRKRTIRGAKLIRLLLDGNTTTPEIADKMAISQAEVAELMEDPQILRQLKAMRQMDRWRERLMSDRWRTTAIWRLSQMAEREEHAETARRACVDLLKVQTPDERIAATRQKQAASMLSNEQFLTEAQAMLGEIGRQRASQPGSDDGN
jgi:hypothetical protein